jgi:hypothetical protein
MAYPLRIAFFRIAPLAFPYPVQVPAWQRQAVMSGTMSRRTSIPAAFRRLMTMRRVNSMSSIGTSLTALVGIVRPLAIAGGPRTGATTQALDVTLGWE